MVRNYWSNLIKFSNLKVRKQLYITEDEIIKDKSKILTGFIAFLSLKGNYKDVVKQTKSKVFDCAETESVSSVYCPISSRSACLPESSFVLSPQNHLPISSTPNTPCHPKAVSHNVSCQTVESSLAPCDACYQVQSILRKTGDALVELFQSEGLPSSLQPLLTAAEDTLELGQMTAGDVSQYANEQLRDIRRLSKHVQDVRATVQPLKDRLVQAESERERFRCELARAQRDFKQEMEKHQANIIQLEFSLRKMQRSVTEAEQRLQEAQQQRKRGAENLQITTRSLGSHLLICATFV